MNDPTLTATQITTLRKLSRSKGVAIAFQEAARMGYTNASTVIPPPVPSNVSAYTVRDGKVIRPNGQTLQIKGINMFGFNADILLPQYLWTMGWKEQIAQVKSLGFNAVRLPFVPETLYSTMKVNGGSGQTYVDAAKNPEFVGKTPLACMDLWIAEAERQGIYVLLDFHSVSRLELSQAWWTDKGSTPWGDSSAWRWSNGALPYTYDEAPYTEDLWVRDLVFVAKRYASKTNIIGIEPFNEPHGPTRWEMGDLNMQDPRYYWKRAVEKASAAILAANPNVLIFVQGTQANFDGKEKSDIPINYGENLQAQAYSPLNVPADKLVFAPHTYGPGTYMKSSFSAPDFPLNLPADWETLFGYLTPKYAVCPTEWGGRFGFEGDNTNGLDKVWGQKFSTYLASKKIAGNFFWCYTPNSGDTGGILDDNLAVIPGKMDMITQTWVV